MAKGSGRVRLNIGGKIFETTTTTLANAGRNSMLGALLDEEWNFAAGDGDASEYFIDRNPECFSVLLDLLRSGELHLPPHLPNKLLYREALFYGLLDHVRAAQCGPFDGNLLRLSSSVYGRAPGDGTAIRAAPDGGCCVAHGSIVHIYDWMLEEHRPINLDYQRINDAGYIDSDRIVITARERPDRAGGGMGLFSSSSGELHHRFHVFHDNKAKTFTAGALSFSDSQFKIFASCKGRCNEYGIGVWDQNTGNQSDFFYEPPGCSLGDADKLQWIKGDSFLMVATLFPRTDNCFIGILDFREKNLVWSWTDEERMAVASLDEKGVLDAIVMEDNRSICVVNQYEDLGFLDLRSNRGGVRWSSRSKLTKGKVRGEESCYPKLVMKGGQLFSSMNDSISVFCGPEWVLTSTLRRSAGDSICDFSIGGDRLFALHSEENVFDVWESPTLPIV
ncbi:BTB/POZ domain-containing protein At2g24240-like [Phalaenopsis equestris]|uniref:BTB/POZ domain-containing protein At2g24240-like n=1 Tax=Phalaenopsis equestris TaxID=78828 RepID=UPI0009E532DE|nr:BTB/POZ domain-containing protein At2g24240-like [Phalaenopsis equestris]